jgi:hypothetical protein
MDTAMMVMISFALFMIVHTAVRLPNDGLQVRRAIGIPAEGIRLLEKNAIAPSTPRLCWMSPGKSSPPADTQPGPVQQFVACDLCNLRPSAHSIPEKDNSGTKHDAGEIGN